MAEPAAPQPTIVAAIFGYDAGANPLFPLHRNGHEKATSHHNLTGFGRHTDASIVGRGDSVNWA